MIFGTIEPDPQGNAAYFGRITNLEDDFELWEGMSLLDRYPDNVECRMDDDFPENLLLEDVLKSLGNPLIVSERLKSFLSENGVRNAEHLPINIINHRGRKVRDKYFICNLFPLVDCIDQSKTKFVWDTLDDTVMDKVEDLTIDESRIPPGTHLFRLKHITSLVLISLDLADKMKKQGFTGFRIDDVSKYRG